MCSIPVRSSLLASLSAVLLLGACDAASFRAAQRADSEAAYLQYLTARPRGAHVSPARGRLEEIRYQGARRADHPLAYHQYLQQYPSGRFARASHSRLAELALERAGTAAELMLVVERYGDTPQGERAAELLPRSLAAEVLASQDPRAAEEYLDRFPTAEPAAAVRSKLAELRYRDLRDEALELESFIDRFSGAPAVARAQRRLERLLVGQVRETPESTLLEELRARFPASPSLPELQQLVASRDATAAVARVDLTALARLDGGRLAALPGAAELVAWCGRLPRKCQALSALAGRALPWRPPGGIESLRAQVYDPDHRLAWSALATLAAVDEEDAGLLLLELLGSERMSSVWVADRALAQWLARRSPAEQRSFAERALRRPYRPANEDETQRRGALLLRAGRAPEGEALLRSLLDQSGRTLSAAYLLLAHTGGGPLPPSLAARLASAARARVDWLKRAFPSELNRDSLVTAAVAEHELFAIDRALGALLEGRSAGTPLLDAKSEAGTLLAEWQARLAKVSTDYHPASEPVPAPEASAHQSGRQAALERLRADASRQGRAVARAICQVSRIEACASVDPLQR